MNNKRHTFHLYHSYHLGNSKSFRGSELETGTKIKYIFIINHNITVTYLHVPGIRMWTSLQSYYSAYQNILSANSNLLLNSSTELISDAKFFISRNSFWFFFFNFYLFIYLFYFWLCWVFVSVRGLSLVAASGGHSSSRCAGLSLSRPLLLGAQAPEAQAQ